MSAAHGSVEVRYAGECSVVPDNGPVWEFQIPCRAHDLCYDLRKIGLSETVTDSGCDNDLRTLALANCAARILPFRIQCNQYANNMGDGVSLPGVVTNQDPPALLIKAKHSTKCLNTSSTVGAPIVQGICGGPNPNIWRIIPIAGSSGKFRIKSSYSGMCIPAPSNSPVFQYGCYDYADQQFRVIMQPNGLYDSTFSLRPAVSNNSQCLDVPGASQNDNVQIITYPCVSGATNEAFFL